MMAAAVACAWCEEPLDEDDESVRRPVVMRNVHDEAITALARLHRECAIRSVIGPVCHQTRTCVCYGGTEEGDPAGLTRRQAAIAAVELFELGDVGEPHRLSDGA